MVRNNFTRIQQPSVLESQGRNSQRCLVKPVQLRINLTCKDFVYACATVSLTYNAQERDNLYDCYLSGEGGTTAHQLRVMNYVVFPAHFPDHLRESSDRQLLWLKILYKSLELLGWLDTSPDSTDPTIYLKLACYLRKPMALFFSHYPSVKWRW